MKIQPTRLCMLLCAIWGSTHVTAFAQTTEPETTKQLGTVVVTASGYEQDIKDAPASISIVTGEELRKRPIKNLEDAVRNLEGVSIVNNSQGNTQEINVRGMPGEYTLILVDGKRQNTRETMSRTTTGVQTNFVPPAAAIERIEVIRGPMSSLYGSDAMGGVINIITRKVPETWTGSVSVGGIMQEDSKLGNTTQSNFWISGPIKNDLLALQVYGNLQNRSEDNAYYANGTTGSNGKRDESIHAKLTITPNKDHDIVLEAGRDVLTYTATPGRSASPTSAPTAINKTEHGHDTLSISHTGRWSFGTTSVTAYQEVGTKDETLLNGKSGASSPKITNSLIDAVTTLPFTSNILKIGGQYSNAKAEGIGKQDTIAGIPANVNDVTVNSWALFVEDEYFVTDKFKLTGGARYDNHDNFGSHVTPRLYANYDINDVWSVHGGIAKGFKAPTIRQSTGGYCISTGGGNLNVGTLCGNPNLKPEESTTQEAGIRFSPAPGTYFSATVFNNDFKNKVSSYDTGVKDPRDNRYNIYIYENIDKVNLRGIELAAAYPINKNWKVSGNYTYTKSKREGDGGEPDYNGNSLNGQPLDKTPKHMANLTVDWQANDQLSAYITGKYIGEMYWAGYRNSAASTRKRSATTTFDLGASYDVTRNFSIKAAIMNVNNKVIPVDTRTRAQGLDGNWLVDEGRRFWLSGNYTF